MNRKTNDADYEGEVYRRERIEELVEQSNLGYWAEILDHIEHLEEEGMQWGPEWTPDPETPAELVAWDFGLVYGYYLAKEDSE